MRLRICLNTPFEADFASIVSLRVPITLDLLSIVHPVFRSRDGATVALFGLQTMFGEGQPASPIIRGRHGTYTGLMSYQKGGLSRKYLDKL